VGRKAPRARFRSGVVLLAAVLTCGWTGGSARAENPAVALRQAPPDTASVRDSIEAENANFIEAWQMGDAERFASLFAEDGAMLRPGGGLTVGRANIRARMREVFSRVRMTFGTITTIDVFVIGDTAYETGSWNFTIGPIGSTTAEPDSGHYVEIWKLDRAGTWKIWRDIGVPKGPVAPSSRESLPPVRRDIVPKPPGQGSRPESRTKAIRFGKLIDGKGHTISDALVVVVGDRIRSVSPYANVKFQVPTDAERFDLSRLTGIPGLIDAHTHMTYWWDRAPGSRPWQQLESRSAMETMFQSRENAMRTLETGVTTVRDLGSFQYMDIALRNLINQGAVVGPRMFVCGYGLYPTMTPYQDAPQPPSGGLADGVDQVMRVTRQQVAAGADVIKVYGSTGSADDVTGDQTYTYEEMKAIVDVARERGKRVAIHSYGPDGARDAIRAGAMSVEHAVDMDDATLREMAKRGVYYVPTVDHNRYYAEHGAEFGYDQAAVARLDAYRARNLETVRRAVKARVKIAMGSDAVFTMFGENTRELGWFVKAGMTPAQALVTATTNGAALLGMEKELGAVAPGYYADLVGVEGDPITDINAVIGGVRWVMKGGDVVVDRRAVP
jgi:uncharacterized protein (TIGR02246 family)